MILKHKLAGLVSAVAVVFSAQSFGITNSYVNFFNLNGDLTKGAYVGGFSYDPAISASVVGTRVELSPNTAICEDPANAGGGNIWACDDAGSTGYGGAFMDYLSFTESTPGAGTSGVFKGCFGVSDMDSAYTLSAFVKFVRNGGDYATLYEAYSSDTCFSFPYTLDDDHILQVGYIVAGPNGLGNTDYGSAYAFTGVDSPPGNIKDLSNTAPIPAMPLYLLGLMAGLLGLFGYRKIAAK